MNRYTLIAAQAWPADASAQTAQHTDTDTDTVPALADGIACRTMEMFEAFNFIARVPKEVCWINEATFWKPDERQPEKIVRHGRVEDTEDGLSEFPHVVLSQARVHDFYLDCMRNAPSRLVPRYSRRLLDVEVNRWGHGGGAVKVIASRSGGDQKDPSALRPTRRARTPCLQTLRACPAATTIAGPAPTRLTADP